jgi:hypothetical protein
MIKMPLQTLCSRATFGLTAALILLPALGPVSRASQDYSITGKRPFSLKATVNDQANGQAEADRPSLSREDVAIIPPESQPPMSRFDLGAEEGANRGPAQPVAQPQVPQEQPASSMIEYGVDWSRWVGQLADRWYYKLTQLEEQSGLQFHTSRPCLIKFTCYPNGQVSEMLLKQTSGVPLYDQLQGQALLQCQPIQPFPQGTQRNSFTIVLGWESHPRKHGERDYKPGSFGRGFPMEIVKQWMNPR